MVVLVVLIGAVGALIGGLLATLLGMTGVLFGALLLFITAILSIGLPFIA